MKRTMAIMFGLLAPCSRADGVPHRTSPRVERLVSICLPLEGVNSR